MSAAKAIAVVGVAGRQDDVLTRTILADPAAVSTVRALTRNTDSVHARQSAALGADVVEADPNDEQSMRLAYDGACGAYAVHDSLTSGSTGPPASLPRESVRIGADMELTQAVAARAAHGAGLRHAEMLDAWVRPQRAGLEPLARTHAETRLLRTARRATL
ncbi:NmrA family NAD(P)-binding protein [Streptomyces xiangluensis]|uniref:NmrA family NAD(P)-binding protein n=1 Tax=Streptomyces xiangluensis TaxID=2665720 RepID=A0ABV8Z8T6_9ACTN